MYKPTNESPARIWARACREFDRLAGVDDDPARISSVADMVCISQFEIDLFEAGESQLTEVQLKPIRKFVDKWTGYSR